MAITHDTALRNALCQTVASRVDTGSGTAKLRIKTSGDVVLVEFDLPVPAFGAPNNGAMNLEGVPLTATCSQSGTAAKFDILDRTGAVVLSGSVGTTTADITFDNISFAAGQQVTLTSLTYTSPA